MQVRRIALALGLPLFLGGGFALGFTNPQIFAPPAPRATLPEGTVFQPLAVTPAELKTRLDQGERIIIADVRGQSSFDRKHIPGARSMPASEIASWGPRLLPDEWVVFYCS